MKRFLGNFLLLTVLASAQVVESKETPAPTYFTTTGARYSYYDTTLTSTTNFGIRVLNSTTPDIPKSLWAVLSVDTTPRNQNSTAAIRIGGRYFLKAISSDFIVYANLQAGATSFNQIASVPASGTSPTNLSNFSNILGTIQGGMGLVWRACHSFNKQSKVNCIVNPDYALNAVSTQAAKPVVGLFVGVAF